MSWESLIVGGAVVWASCVVLTRGVALFRSFWWLPEKVATCGTCVGCPSSASGLVSLTVPPARTPPPDPNPLGPL